MVRVLVHDLEHRVWLCCEQPREVVVAHGLADVIPALRHIEDRVADEGALAVGFIAYEAAPAFDRALRVREAHPGFPLLWFGIFERVEYRHAIPTTRLEHTVAWRPDISRGEYDRAIRCIKNYIAAGDTYQVNYSFRMSGRFDGDPLALFAHLLAAQPSRTAAFVETDEFAVCSASPELFFTLDGRKIVTRPMKGTIPRGRSSSEDERNALLLHDSEKNRAENVMIVDMMRNDLGRIADPGSVRVPALFTVERYPTLWQMTSTVTAETDAPVSEILRAVFPCASVTGAPKARTMEIIAELETTPRRVYTGAVGFIAPNRRAQFNVAIRTVLIDRLRREAEYGVGGGIVWDSTAEAEYDECLTKARVLNEARPDFELFETMRFSPREGFVLLDEHLKRLRDSVRYFDYPLDEPLLLRMLKQLDRNLRGLSHDSRVRLTLHRDGRPSFDIRPLAVPSPTPIRVRLAAVPVDSRLLFLYHKTSYRKMYDDALVGCEDCDDVILWNERGEVTESTISNIVVELEGKLYTPPVECGLLPGTLRARLLREGAVLERVIMKDDLGRASQVFLINSVRGWQAAQVVS